MKIKSIYLPILIFSLLAIGIYLGKYINFPSDSQSISKNNSRNKLNKLIDFINKDYVDNVNTDSIVDSTVDNILAKLDPHSVYITSDNQIAEAQNMKGEFIGIGINFYVINDTITIINNIPGGPAEKAGLQAGDKILFANNAKVFGKKQQSDSLYSKLKGKENSKVKITIYRKSSHNILTYNIVRKIVPIKSVDIALLLNQSTGYIKINRFAETTYDEFITDLENLKKHNIKSLVIDLRDNGGGYLEIAQKIADEFLKNKQLIVFTKNKKGKIENIYATEKGIFENGKLFVLINEYSASASEILAGAIQDNDRGIIIGRRSFGKGLVQREMDFDDGSAVRLTIARYYTPTGRSIQKPYSKGKMAYFEDFDKRFENGELYKKDSIKINDSLKFKTPKGKIVYGGGGIVPDVFVPREVVAGDEVVNKILDSGIIEPFIFQEIDKNRMQFKGLSVDQIQQKVYKNDIIFENFRNFLSKNGLDIEIENSKTIIKRQLFLETIKQLFSINEYYQTLLKDDLMVKTVFKN